MQCVNTSILRWRAARVCALLPAAAAILSFNACAETGKRPPGLAAANFAFKDTSGEARDQTTEHAARLKSLNETIQTGLGKSKQVRAVRLSCQNDKCNAAEPGLQALATDAKKAGANYLLFGQVHKMSTLVGWIKYAVVNLHENSPVCERTLSYRGDNDQAWEHAAKFTVRDVQSNCAMR